MSKSKASAQPAATAKNPSGKREPKSMIQDGLSGQPESSPTTPAKKQLANTTIKIVYQGTCPKLTTRGRGDLTYELGFDDATGNPHLRIAANAGSGAFSHEWLGLDRIRAALTLGNDQQQSFTATAMRPLFFKRSSNNHGYLAAVLKAEGVLEAFPGQPVMLRLGNWEQIFEKIAALKEKGVSLPDQIAIAAKQRAERRALALSQTTKPAGSKSKAKTPPAEPVEKGDEPPEE
jgi:hypothetical protein